MKGSSDQATMEAVLWNFAVDGSVSRQTIRSWYVHKGGRTGSPIESSPMNIYCDGDFPPFL